MLGGNVFGCGPADAATSFTILDAFVDAGFNFIDTADVYSRWIPGHRGGESESILGQWFARSGKRDKVILATKVGMDMGDGKKGLARSYILKAAEDSLRRLQTDYVDLYQSHTDDASTPLDETLEAYQQLIQQGKVRLIGASNYKAPRLREAIDLAKRENLPVYQTLQPEYNFYDRKEFETELPARSKGTSRPRRHPLLLARQRIPHRQIQIEGRHQRSQPRIPRGKILRRPRHENPQSSRRSRHRNRS